MVLANVAAMAVVATVCERVRQSLASDRASRVSMKVLGEYTFWMALHTGKVPGPLCQEASWAIPTLNPEPQGKKAVVPVVSAESLDRLLRHERIPVAAFQIFGVFQSESVGQETAPS